MLTSLRGHGSARTFLLRMAADQERADRIRGLKDRHPEIKWRMIAAACGVTERAAAEWARSGGIATENAEKLADVFQKAGEDVNFDWIWHGPREDTPSPFAQRDQVDDVRAEFRQDVDQIKQELADLRVTRESLIAEIAAQNKLLADQTKLLADIRELVDVLKGAQVERVASAGRKAPQTGPGRLPRRERPAPTQKPAKKAAGTKGA